MEQPWVFEAGDGPGVVCLHANASTSGQWKHLAQRLASRHRVLAPDLYGAGRSPDWRWQRPITLADEADLIEPVLARAGRPLALVAHSYGAAVALVTALRDPRRVAALVLYEPSLFALVDADAPRPNDADGIREAVADADRLLRAGERDAAAERFIDYWMEPGSWRRTPAGRRAAIAATIANVRRWGRALFTEPTPLAALRGLEVPVLLMIGDRTTASARAVTTRLLGALPQRELHEFENVGHMGPVTHPERVNAVIDRFLARTFAGRVAGADQHAAVLAT